MRQQIEEAVTAWERRAKASMHLDALLHKKIKADLIDSLMATIEAAPKLTAKMVKEAVEQAKPDAIKPKANGTFEVHPAQSEEEKQMAALKASVKKAKKQ